MQRFVHFENIKHYKQLLERTTDQAERARILCLLTEEEAQIPLDDPPPIVRIDSGRGGA